MISGTITITNSKLTDIILTASDGRIISDDFEKLMLVRNLVMAAVNNFEKENQAKYLIEAKKAEPYKEKF